MQTLAFENYTQITLHTRDLKMLLNKFNVKQNHPLLAHQIHFTSEMI